MGVNTHISRAVLDEVAFDKNVVTGLHPLTQTGVPTEKHSCIFIAERCEIFFALTHEAVDQLIVGKLCDPRFQPNFKKTILYSRSGNPEDAGQLIKQAATAQVR